MVTVSLPDVDQEMLSLDLEKNVLKLRAPMVNVRPSGATLENVEREEKGGEEEEASKVPEEPQGLVVTDVDDEEEEEIVVEKKEKKAMRTSDQETKGGRNGCTEKKEYILSLRLPQNTNKELLSANFEDGQLLIHFPSRAPMNPSRPVPIQ